MAMLEAERQDAIKRIERYKKKLDTKKLADKIEESRNLVVKKPTGTSNYQ
jgi:hypothetical protein